MRNILKILLSVCALGVVSCAPKGVSMQDLQTLYLPRYASGFSICDAGGPNTLIRITNPWQGADGVEKSIFVCRDGAPAPDGFSGAVVRAPVRRVVCMSSSYVAMFDAVGCGSRVAGVSGAGFISTPSVREGIDSGRVADVGYGAGVDFELLTALEPDIVLIYGVADENRSLADKLGELGIPCGYMGDYTESSALGKAEWMVVAGELCDRRPLAESLLDKTAARYDSVREAAAAAVHRPKVILNAPYRDVWFMPGDKSYIVSMLRDAAGECLTSGSGDMSLPVAGEKAFAMLLEADVWLHPGQVSTLGELAAQNPQFMQVPAVESGRVFNNNLRSTPAGGSDFWESGAVRPDVVLQDLVRILHPELSDGIAPYYYRRVQ